MITVRSGWTPIREAVALREAMDRMWEDRVARLAREEGAADVITPPVDAWEDSDAVVIELAVPGADPAKVDVRYENDRLVVSGEIASRDPEKQWVIHERARGPFLREFTLRTPVEADKAEAHFVNGVLTLTLPKAESVKPRKIAVQSA
jgi:HSP20 family protein